MEAELPSAAIRVDAAGRFTFPVGCDADGPSCAGDLRVYTTGHGPRRGGTQAAAAAAKRLAVARFSIRPGKRKRVPVRLNATGRRALARAGGKAYTVNLRIRERSASGRYRGIAEGSVMLRATARPR